MTAETIINAVRARLGDSVRERWDNETLLLYVSLCQNDICVSTNFNRADTTIPLDSETYIYDLPTDCLVVNRFEYNNQLLPVETRNAIDDNKAVYPLILKDNLAFNKIEFRIGDDYDTLAEALINVYGVVINANELVDTFGVVTDIDDPVGIPPTQPLDELFVYYTAVPALLQMDVTDPENPVLPIEDLLLPDIWFQAFFHYVSGMALQDDNDANNIARGEAELGKYSRILAQIHKNSSKDFTSNIKTKLVTKMRSI